MAARYDSAQSIVKKFMVQPVDWDGCNQEIVFAEESFP